MANQPEIDSYDTGIYQFEITDPAQGGVGGLANKPLLSLANRTNWLKAQIAAILASLGNFAGLNSPPFTGTPTAPTAAAGDQSLTISNTAFAQRMFSGEAAVPIPGTGNIVLTQPQWGVGIIMLTGALTGARSVIFPNTGRWVVWNITTGAFVVTCQTAAGTGIAITQGKSREIWGDGTNIQAVHTDYDSIAMTGAPTAPTAPITDVSTRVANMAAIANALGALCTNGSNYITIPNQLIPSFPLIIQFGHMNLPTGNGDVVTLPISFNYSIRHIITVSEQGFCNLTSWNNNGSSLSTFLAYAKTPSGAFTSTPYAYIAIGT